MAPHSASPSSKPLGAGLLALLLLAACATTSSSSQPAPAARAAPPPCETARACIASCEAGNVPSCTLAADRLRQGLGIPRDVHFARRLYSRACEAQDALGCAGLASVTQGPQAAPAHSRALPMLESACTQGDAEACISEGMWRLEGQGTPADPTTAEARLRRGVELLAQQCQGGSGSACVRAAGLLDMGPQPLRDTSRAVSLHQQACDAGVAASCSALALRYLTGRDVQPDKPRMQALFQRADELLRKACEAGNVEACAELGQPTMLRPGVSSDANQAHSFLEQACHLGDIGSCMRVVESLLLSARAHPPDAQRAMQFKELAQELREKDCQAGSGAACLVLAQESPAERARALRQRACELGHTEVCVVAE